MHDIDRPLATHPHLALVAAFLWGLLETVALARSRWRMRRLPGR